MKQRSHRNERMARVYDDEIYPIWTERFCRLLLAELEVPPKSAVLEVGCATGSLTFEVLKRMGDEGRVIALEPTGTLLDIARQKAGALAGKRIFFRTEPAREKLAFANDVYDLVVSNLGIASLDDKAFAIKEFARVTKPNGHVHITLPLAETFNEFFDVFREVLVKLDLDDTLARLEQHIASFPSIEQVESWFSAADLREISSGTEPFHLLFNSAREFLYAPVIEYGPLQQWKEIVGKGEAVQEVFWKIKESIESYFHNRAFQITVKAGYVRGTK